MATYDDFFEAIEYGDVEQVKRIVESGFDPTFDNNQGLKYAVYSNRLDMVKYLLTLPGVEKGIDHALGIIDRLGYERPDIANFLKQYKRDRFEKLGNRPLNKKDLFDAIKNYDLDLVQYIIQRGVNPAVKNNSPLRLAAKLGALRIVKYLLTLPGVDSTAYDNWAVRLAAANGHTDTVKHLLLFPGVTDAIPEAIESAKEGNHPEIVRLLEQYRHVIGGIPVITFPTIIPFTMANMPDLS